MPNEQGPIYVSFIPDDAKSQREIWAPRLASVAKNYGGVGTLISPCVLLASAIIAFCLFQETQEANTKKRQQDEASAIARKEESDKLLRNQSESHERQLIELRRTIEQNTMATIYQLGNETSKQLVQFAEIRPYFEAVGDHKSWKPIARLNRTEGDKKRLRDHHDKMEKELAKAENKQMRERVWAYCQALCDFYEYVFVLRDIIPGDDFDGWWLYFCDAYDESPFIQQYLQVRADWYTIDEVLKGTPEERQAWFEKDSINRRESRKKRGLAP